jgi:glycerophosphoryl diester phosphodiesterase
LAYRPQILAHRGASNAARENTVDAFQLAARMGANAVELDVRRAADGRLMVSHDPLPDDIRHDVPTLSAALDACAGMWVNVEIKNDPEEPDFDPTDSIADDTIALLLDRHEDGRWLISSFRMRTIDRCRALAPEISTAYLTVEIDEGVIARLVRKGHRALHPWYLSLTPEILAEAHDAGVQVNVWTCDDPTAMLELSGWGVDGICTNIPDIAIALLARSGN